MLPLKNRLKKRKDFDLIYKTGKNAFASNFFLKFKENGLSESRIGISIGTKFSPKAFLRNKTKRQIREVFRRELPFLREGFDIVIIPKKRKEENSSFEEWQIAIKSALKSSDLIKNKK